MKNYLISYFRNINIFLKHIQKFMDNININAIFKIKDKNNFKKNGLNKYKLYSNIKKLKQKIYLKLYRTTKYHSFKVIYISYLDRKKKNK
jgi:hypothetical protein